MPHPNWGNNAEDFGVPGWLYDPAQVNSDWKLPDIETGALWPYIKNHGMYRCPFDPPPWMWPIQQISSYCMNGAFVRYGRKINDRRVMYKINRFKSDAVVFWEVDESLTTAKGGFWNDGSNYPGEGITRRHGKGTTGATWSCIDGRAEWITFQEYDQQQNRGPSRLWCAPDHEFGGRKNAGS